jgi:hypothetical protein
MSPALELALIVTLAVLLAATSATAGALWWRSRPEPPGADEAGALADRLRALDALLSRLESAPATAPRRRLDRAEPNAVAGPTLIAVPDLAAPAGDPSPASAELARRFGAIWDLADVGATPDAIARATGQPIGQVELILGLRRQLAAGARA